VITVVWLSESLRILALPVGVLLTLSHSDRSDHLPRLIFGIIIILAVCLLHWLTERRQRREQPEIVWLPWRKRIWLTLIPLMICAPVCVYLGLRYNDPVVSPVSIGSPQFFARLFFWLCSYMTVILIRIMDNRFSHREAK
jgi:hypothetical protein